MWQKLLILVAQRLHKAHQTYSRLTAGLKIEYCIQTLIYILFSINNTFFSFYSIYILTTIFYPTFLFLLNYLLFLPTFPFVILFFTHIMYSAIIYLPFFFSTLPYMSPEMLFKNADYTIDTDMWSLGILFYFIISRGFV